MYLMPAINAALSYQPMQSTTSAGCYTFAIVGVSHLCILK